MTDDQSVAPVFSIDLDIKTEEVNRCEFTKDGKRVVIGAQGNPVSIWTVETGRRVIAFEDRSVASWAVAWSKDERYIFFGTRDGLVEMREVDSGQCLHTYTGHHGLMRCLDSTSDNSLLLSGSGTRDSTVRLWDVQSERCLRIMEGHSDGVYDVAFEPTQRRALSGSRDTTVRMWDLESGKCLQVFKGHSYHVHCVLWSTDQRRVLSCSQDIRLWDVETGRCIRVFNYEPTITIRRLAWSADERRALSAAHDGTVRLWDVDSGRCVRVFEGHPVGVVSVAWSADEQRAYSCDWNGSIRTWDVK